MALNVRIFVFNHAYIMNRLELITSVEDHFVRTCFYLDFIDLLQHVRKKSIIVDEK